MTANERSPSRPPLLLLCLSVGDHHRFAGVQRFHARPLVGRANRASSKEVDVFVGQARTRTCQNVCP